MDNNYEQGAELQDLTVSNVIHKLTGEKTITLYGYCPGCNTVHGDIDRLRQYLQFLSDQSMINFN